MTFRHLLLALVVCAVLLPASGGLGRSRSRDVFSSRHYREVLVLQASVNNDAREFYGLAQIALHANRCRGFHGLAQVGLVNWNDGTFCLVQAGLLNHDSGHMRFVQVGLVNMARSITGVQIGLFNATRKLQGVQLGLVNFSRHGGLPLMVLANVGW